MPLIQKIAELRHPGPLREFTWPTGLLAFARYNLILGSNASGKTTLSRLLRCMEKGLPPAMGVRAKILSNRGDIESSDFPTINLPVRVFNRDFVDENVFPVVGGSIPLILVLGEESVEKKKRVEKLQEDLGCKEDDFESARKEERQAEKEIARYCKKEAARIKNIMRDGSSRGFDNYHKGLYRSRAGEMMEAGNHTQFVLDSDMHGRLLSQLGEKVKKELPELNYTLPSVDGLTSRVAHFLSKTITTAVIDRLKENIELGEWVRTGLDLHKRYETTVCQFCDQTIPKERLGELEGHFSETFGQFIQELNDLTSELKSQAVRARQVKMELPIRTELYSHLGEQHKDASLALITTVSSFSEYVDNLVNALEKKRTSPFQKLNLDIEVPEIDVFVVSNFN